MVAKTQRTKGRRSQTETRIGRGQPSRAKGRTVPPSRARSQLNYVEEENRRVTEKSRGKNQRETREESAFSKHVKEDNPRSTDRPKRKNNQNTREATAHLKPSEEKKRLPTDKPTSKTNPGTQKKTAHLKPIEDENRIPTENPKRKSNRETRESTQVPDANQRRNVSNGGGDAKGKQRQDLAHARDASRDKTNRHGSSGGRFAKPEPGHQKPQRGRKTTRTPSPAKKPSKTNLTTSPQKTAVPEVNQHDLSNIESDHRVLQRGRTATRTPSPEKKPTKANRTSSPQKTTIPEVSQQDLSNIESDHRVSQRGRETRTPSPAKKPNKTNHIESPQQMTIPEASQHNLCNTPQASNVLSGVSPARAPSPGKTERPSPANVKTKDNGNLRNGVGKQPKFLIEHQAVPREASKPSHAKLQAFPDPFLPRQAGTLENKRGGKARNKVTGKVIVVSPKTNIKASKRKAKQVPKKRKWLRNLFKRRKTTTRRAMMDTTPSSLQATTRLATTGYEATLGHELEIPAVSSENFVGKSIRAGETRSHVTLPNTTHRHKEEKAGPLCNKEINTAPSNVEYVATAFYTKVDQVLDTFSPARCVAPKCNNNNGDADYILNSSYPVVSDRTKETTTTTTTTSEIPRTTPLSTRTGSAILDSLYAVVTDRDDIKETLEIPSSLSTTTRTRKESIGLNSSSQVGAGEDDHNMIETSKMSDSKQEEVEEEGFELVIEQYGSSEVAREIVRDTDTRDSNNDTLLENSDKELSSVGVSGALDKFEYAATAFYTKVDHVLERMIVPKSCVPTCSGEEGSVLDSSYPVDYFDDIRETSRKKKTGDAQKKRGRLGSSKAKRGSSITTSQEQPVDSSTTTATTSSTGCDGATGSVEYAATALYTKIDNALISANPTFQKCLTEASNCVAVDDYSSSSPSKPAEEEEKDDNGMRETEEPPPRTTSWRTLVRVETSTNTKT